jgi:hypothetical protein
VKQLEKQIAAIAMEHGLDNVVMAVESAARGGWAWLEKLRQRVA